MHCRWACGHLLNLVFGSVSYILTLYTITLIRPHCAWMAGTSSLAWLPGCLYPNFHWVSPRPHRIPPNCLMRCYVQCDRWVVPQVRRAQAEALLPRACAHPLLCCSAVADCHYYLPNPSLIIIITDGCIASVSLTT